MCRRQSLLDLFRFALESPFPRPFPTAIPPPAALWKKEDNSYLLFLIGFPYCSTVISICQARFSFTIYLHFVFYKFSIDSQFCGKIAKKDKYTEEDITVTYYYRLKSYGYTVKYYYDGVIDDTKTESSTAQYGSTINSYTDKNEGSLLEDKTKNIYYGKETDVAESREGSENTTLQTMQDYLETLVGNNGNYSNSKLLQEFRDTFLNIDMMVIGEFKGLFMGLW